MAKYPPNEVSREAGVATAPSPSREDGHDAVQRATPRRRRHISFALNLISTPTPQRSTREAERIPLLPWEFNAKVAEVDAKDAEIL